MTDPGTKPKIYIEAWNADFGSPNQIDDSEEPTDLATIPEDEPFGFVALGAPSEIPLAFVDGIQQLEAHLVQAVNERFTPGLACALAVGGVTVAPGERPKFAHLRPKRLVIWTAGSTGSIPAVRGGWNWEEVTIPDTGIKSAHEEMVRQRRTAEAALGHQLESDGWWVVCDGTDGRLYSPRPDGASRKIMGCIKSQHVRLLPEPYARQLQELSEGERTTLFRTPSSRYSCYLRLGAPRPWQSPLSGIVRLEFAGGFKLHELRAVANTFASNLPRFAGVAHVDPRAPQNLQPIGALETHLRRTLGDQELARRAIHDAIERSQA